MTRGLLLLAAGASLIGCVPEARPGGASRGTEPQVLRDQTEPPCMLCPPALCGGYPERQDYCTMPCDPADPVAECTSNLPSQPWVCALHPSKDNIYGPACWKPADACPSGCPQVNNAPSTCVGTNRCVEGCWTTHPCSAPGVVCGFNPRFAWVLGTLCWPPDLLPGDYDPTWTPYDDGAPTGGDPGPSGDP